MTRNEAIKYIRNVLKGREDKRGKTEIDIALEMAIEALEKEPCEDVVSRLAVLDALDKSKYSNEFCEEHHIDWSINLGMAHIVVNELKPVTPQPKMGKWSRVTDKTGHLVWECDKCGWQQRFYTNFCPDCGSRKP